MHWQYTPYALPLVVAAGVSGALSVFAWRRRPAAGATSFSLLMFAVAEWALGYALELASDDAHAILFWANVEYLGVVAVPAAWLAFALAYTGRERWLSRRNLVVLAVEPVIILLLTWTDGRHGLMRGTIRLSSTTGFTTIIATHGPAFWINVAYSYALLALGTVLISPLFQGLVRPNFLYRGQASMLLVAVAVPWAGNILFVAGLSPFPGLDLTPFAFTLSGAALASSLLRFRLLDVVPVARDAVIESMGAAVIVLDEQGRILDLNPSAQQTLGLHGRAIIGQPFAQPFAEWPVLVQRCETAREAYTETILNHAATARWFDVHISPLRDRSGHLTGRLVILDDITARVQAEEALRDSEERFRKIFQEAPIGMALLDEEERLLQVNQAFCDMLGYGEPELTARTLSAITHPEDMGKHALLTAQALAGAINGYQVELRYLKKNRETLWAELTTTVIRNGGSLYRLAMIQNIFERKRAELLEDDQRRVAYELHDGLAQVAAGAHLHLQAFAGHYPPRSPRARQELDRALELVQLAAREARNVIAGLRPTIVEELGLASALRMHVEALRTDGWTITYEEALGPERLPPTLETALFRVALEALTNIRKHARGARVRVVVARAGPDIRLEVRDWGCGFDPADPATAGPAGHIGLRAMRERIALLGGRFSVQSSPGAGTWVVAEVPLPLSDTVSDAPDPAVAPASASAQGDHRVPADEERGTSL